MVIVLIKKGKQLIMFIILGFSFSYKLNHNGSIGFYNCSNGARILKEFLRKTPRILLLTAR